MPSKQSVAAAITFGNRAVAGASNVSGNVFYLDSGATFGQDQPDHGLTTSHPFATLDYAFSRCTANNGDVIYALPGHAETGTAIGLDVAGVSVICLGHGRARPTWTATTGASDLFDVSVANIYLENAILLGAASGCTALIDLAAGGTDFRAHKCTFRMAADPLHAITVNASRFHFSLCQWFGESADNDIGISIETTALTDWIVEDCLFQFGALGLDEAGISCKKKTSGGLVKNCDFIGMVVTAVDIDSSTTARGDGMIANCGIAAFAQTDNIDTLIDAGGFILLQNYASDLPAEAGGLVPVTTPA